MKKYDIGIIGLGVMGRNLALNFESRGFAVAAWDLDADTRAKAEAAFAGRNLVVCASQEDFAGSLASPKIIMLMVPAGKAVDSVIQGLLPLLVKGDIVIDGGNTHFPDTERRCEALKKEGILFVGTGVSGGEEGALRGPSIMPGGNPDAWPAVKPLLQAIAARVPDGSPCCEWVGNSGAGHFVKMVHNGIEYGDMQMISEAYFLMREALCLPVAEIADIFAEWNSGVLNSYLIEITGKILKVKDPQSGNALVDMILDSAGQKGTGKWTVQAALDLGAAAPTLSEAVFARAMSSLKDERAAAEKILAGPGVKFSGDRKSAVEKIRSALYCSKICSYAQGFALMKAADAEYGWNLNYGNIALLWRAGCIIRAAFLDNIKDAYRENPALSGLLTAPFFSDALRREQSGWRETVSLSALHGIPAPAFSSALAYYDSYRSGTLPANLIQAQRDYFGAHKYERVDSPRGRFFHTDWASFEKAGSV